MFSKVSLPKNYLLVALKIKVDHLYDAKTLKVTLFFSDFIPHIRCLKSHKTYEGDHILNDLLNMRIEIIKNQTACFCLQDCGRLIVPKSIRISIYREKCLTVYLELSGSFLRPQQRNLFVFYLFVRLHPLRISTCPA